jgi:hypothetical protein
VSAETNDPKDWLTSKEVEKQLRISSCELMHLREAGKLPFRKKGNAFFYKINKTPKAAGARNQNL